MREFDNLASPGFKTDIHKAPQPLSSANGFGMSRFSMAADIIICLCEWVHSLASHPSVLQSVMESGNVRPMGTQGGPLGRVTWQLTRMFCSNIWYCAYYHGMVYCMYTRVKKTYMGTKEGPFGRVKCSALQYGMAGYRRLMYNTTVWLMIVSYVMFGLLWAYITMVYYWHTMDII